MIEQGHTPEPWKTTKGNGIFLTMQNGETNSFPIVYSASGMDVAYIVPMDDTKHADAARIVACVNALAGLNPDGVAAVVDALQYAVNWAEGYADANGDTPAFLSDARAALAKLEGRQNA